MHRIVEEWRRARSKRNPFVKPHRAMDLTIGDQPFLYSYHGWSVTAGQNPGTRLWEAELERTDPDASEKTMPFELAHDVHQFKAKSRGEVLRLAKYMADLADHASAMGARKGMRYWYLFMELLHVASDRHYDVEVDQGVGTKLTRGELARAWKEGAPPEWYEKMNKLPLKDRLALMDRAVEIENLRQSVFSNFAPWWRGKTPRAKKKRPLPA